MIDLTRQEREFIIWALGWVEGAASEMDDYETGKEAWRIAEKLKEVTPAP